MAKILIFKRKEQTEGTIKLRFRIRDGRDTQIFHPSDIEADVKALKKLNDDGTKKDGVVIYDTELSEKIKKEIKYLTLAYEKMKENGYDLTSEVLEKMYLEVKKPDEAEREAGHTLVQEFQKYLKDAVKLKFVGEQRLKTLNVVLSELERYLAIKGRTKILVKEFTDKDVLSFQDFVFDEYKYVKNHKRLYSGMSEKNIPQKRRAPNTVAVRMKALQSVFRGIDTDYNPFDKLPKKYRTAITKEEYEEPICLDREEFFKIYATSVPDTLRETKDAFLLQCSFGCRIGDFTSLCMDNVAVDDNGIPYIHYLPQKTIRTNVKKIEIETPIMRYALEIIKKYKFNFQVLKYVSGKSGYNVKIKSLLQHCEIDRLVKGLDDETGEIVSKPLYEFGSSKLCRKTNVNIMREVQIDEYAAGLHAVGSQAVECYHNNGIRSRFILMCAAFNQPIYKVDKEFNIIE